MNEPQQNDGIGFEEAQPYRVPEGKESNAASTPPAKPWRLFLALGLLAVFAVAGFASFAVFRSSTADFGTQRAPIKNAIEDYGYTRSGAPIEEPTPESENERSGENGS